MATLAANLASLFGVAKHQLPNLADQFGSAKTGLDASGDTASGFDRNEGMGSGPQGCHPEFQAFTDQIVSFLTSTEANLDDTAVALQACAKSYSHRDTATAAEFKKLTGEG